MTTCVEGTLASARLTRQVDLVLASTHVLALASPVDLVYGRLRAELDCLRG